VRTLQLGARAAGANAVTWDGLDDRGAPADSGSYFVSVSAKAADGSAVTTSTSIRGVVTGVSFDGAVPQLLVNGTTIKLADVTQISAAPSGG
jgi:flagellar basal-body rod modification protein FlgD